jgi:hypothetical protein
LQEAFQRNGREGEGVKKERGRGQPRATNYSEVLSRKDTDDLNSGLPPHLWSDGKGKDNRISPPPWSPEQRAFMKRNLNTLYLDPTSNNMIAQFHPSFLDALLEYPDESTKRAIAEDMAALLSDNSASTIHDRLQNIVKLAEKRDQFKAENPHAAFQALRAYYDYVEEFGFDPTPKKLSDFMIRNSTVYPAAEGKKTGVKSWDDSFAEIIDQAGLARIRKSTDF